ncbi:chalcone isomerase family protein [Photobacterium ganghwense]|uniref:Periplasmic protein n=1 Tax=Photobacterium ganghwense TaxID=320778 RepID=A0A0J1HEN4_9GAMM|nr:chalcone isomerase family protein [Photobacterium ganghwense]KLV10110.1 periplasmic protein [Photobacterium ganghwense]MBV1841125.1 chalcone isomerase family protein [Photobacterium ganghwense]QSV17273.1 chalcone isomerase family protein [Photobacterium ganghwense]
MNNLFTVKWSVWAIVAAAILPPVNASSFDNATLYSPNNSVPISPTRSTLPWQRWPVVGDATLRWGPWVIYDSELRTPNGRYHHQDSQLALVIKYQRNIENEDLLTATDEQWQHLGIQAGKRAKWLRMLAQIWPDVKQGDRLIFVLQDRQGVFYQDNRQIGIISDPEMARSFINIWLSPQTAYPDIRRQLIGQS